MKFKDIQVGQKVQYTSLDGSIIEGVVSVVSSNQSREGDSVLIKIIKCVGICKQDNSGVWVCPEGLKLL